MKSLNKTMKSFFFFFGYSHVLIGTKKIFMSLHAAKMGVEKVIWAVCVSYVFLLPTRFRFSLVFFCYLKSSYL